MPIAARTNRLHFPRPFPSLAVGWVWLPRLSADCLDQLLVEKKTFCNRQGIMSSAQISQTTGAVLQTGYVTGAHIDHTDVKVKNVGVAVEVPKNCFSMTNHMVKQIKNYLPPGVILNRFVFFPGLHWIIMIALLICLLMAALWILSTIAIVVILVCLAITCQYIHVCRKSLPWLMLLPVIDGLPKLNSHIEIEINHVEGVYLKARQAGLGQVVASSGKVKLLVMSPGMARYITQSMAYSICLFLSGLICFILAFILLIVNWIVFYG